MSDSCHINLPVQAGRTGFVFICPGRFEQRSGRPCAGQTGTHLEAAVQHLAAMQPSHFPHRSRYDYLITNVWDRVEFKGLTLRSVPTKDEVANPANLLRLHKELAGLENLVACGALAHHAVRRCIATYGFSGRVAYVKHTSRQALGCPTRAQYPQTIMDWAAEVVRQLAAAPQHS